MKLQPHKATNRKYIKCFYCFRLLHKHKIEATGFIPQINQWVFALRFYKKSKKLKTRHVRICPKCKSKNIKEDMSAFQVTRMFNPSVWICNNCGYEGYIFQNKSK